MNELRKKFEEAPKVAELLKDNSDELVVFNDELNVYETPMYKNYIPEFLYEINFGWLVFQEQQRRIDDLKSGIQQIWTELDDRQSKEYIIEQCEIIIKELLK